MEEVTNHVFITKIQQELEPIICLETKTNILPELNLKIIFQLNHENIEWHNAPYPKIMFIKILNLETNNKIEYDDLPMIAQINSQKQCRIYLHHNKLDPYHNIFPINSAPYRFSNPLNQDYSQIADIITFPGRALVSFDD